MRSRIDRKWVWNWSYGTDTFCDLIIESYVLLFKSEYTRKSRLFGSLNSM